LRPSTTPSFFDVCTLADRVQNTYGDIRDLESVIASAPPPVERKLERV